MTSGFNPFNVVAAVGICASLAMLGLEIQYERPIETHYDFSVVAPHHAPGADEDDSILVPEPRDRTPDSRSLHHGEPRDEDGDDDGPPIPPPGENDPIPT